MTDTRAGRCLLIVAASLLLSVAPVLAAADSVAAPLTIAAYVTQLDAISAAVAQSADGSSHELSALVSKVPRVWHVGTPPGAFDIENARLLQNVRSWRTTGDPTARARLLMELRLRRSEAARFNQPPGDVAVQRVLLADILRRSAFQNVHGQTWMDRLRQRVLELLVDALRPVLQASSIPIVSRYLVYGLIAASLVVLGLWLRRFVRREAEPHVAVAASRPAVALEWRGWLTAMEAAAARGSWREAIHFSYWCAVSFLEAKGAWPPDRSRTPREYLQLLPPAGEERPALAALTRRFELVWYGVDAADSQSFAEATVSLKKIGCPPA
jgi:hypothetical protein